MSVARLLLLRSTARTRSVAAEFGPFLHAAYPARYDHAIAAIRDGDPWPGDAIVWCRVDRGTAVVLERPPRGIRMAH